VGLTAGGVIPCYLVIDTSSSMRDVIGAVNDELAGFLDRLSTEAVIVRKYHLSVITFDAAARVLLPLTEIARIPELPKLTASVEAGSRFYDAFELLRSVIADDMYRLYLHGREPQQPGVFFLTDGVNVGPDGKDVGPDGKSAGADWHTALAELTDASRFYGAPAMFAFGIGDDASEEEIRTIGRNEWYMPGQGTPSANFADCIKHVLHSIKLSVHQRSGEHGPWAAGKQPPPGWRFLPRPRSAPPPGGHARGDEPDRLRAFVPGAAGDDGDGPGDGPAGRPEPAVSDGDLVGEGVAGCVFAVPGDDGLVWKKYRERPDPRHAARLRRLIAWRAALPPGDREFLDRHCAWPLEATLGDDGAASGFLMRRAPDAFWARGPRDGRPYTLELQHLLDDDAPRRLGIPVVPLTQRLGLIADLALILSLLEREEMVYGDVSPFNVLWTVTPEPAVFLIDCDNARPVSQAVSDGGLALPRDTEWRDPWPGARFLPDVHSDRHALAVFSYSVLYGLMPPDEPRVPENAPRLPGLEQLVSDGVWGSRWARPCGADWHGAIVAARAGG
jgi:hypothetical protein